MKIAYVCGDLGVPVFGTKGASIHVRELCRALRALGHELLLVTPRGEGSPPPGFDVPVVETSGRDGAGSVSERALRGARALRRDAFAPLQEFAPDVIYERYSLFGTAGAWLANELGLPHVLEVNAPLTDEQAAYRGLDRLEEALEVERWLLCSADAVVVVSKRLEQWALALGVEPERVTVVRNGVDPSRFDVSTGERETLAVADRSVVGFVGSLKPWHDVRTLVRAVARLQNATLVVVGDGPERAPLEELARSQGVDAVFTGAVPHERVPAYIAAFDVAVAPYTQDDSFYFSPLKLAEYLAAGRPVVAADLPELRHCVRPGETGALYVPGDAEALAASIAALLADPARAHMMAAAGREHVLAEHSWERNAATIVALARRHAAAKAVA